METIDRVKTISPKSPYSARCSGMISNTFKWTPNTNYQALKSEMDKIIRDQTEPSWEWGIMISPFLYELFNKQKDIFFLIYNIISRELSTDKDLRNLKNYFTRKITRIFNCEIASIFLITEDGQKLVIEVSDGWAWQEIIKKYSHPIIRDWKPNGLVGHCAVLCEPIIAEDQYTHPFFDRHSVFNLRRLLANSASCPLIVLGKLIGVVQLWNIADGEMDQERINKINAINERFKNLEITLYEWLDQIREVCDWVFSHEDLMLLNMACDILWQKINEYLLLKKKEDETLNYFKEFMFLTLDKVDPYTIEHSDRVQKLSSEFASRIKFRSFVTNLDIIKYIIRNFEKTLKDYFLNEDINIQRQDSAREDWLEDGKEIEDIDKTIRMISSEFVEIMEWRIIKKETNIWDKIGNELTNRLREKWIITDVNILEKISKLLGLIINNWFNDDELRLFKRAGLLHDVWKTKIDKKILLKPDILNTKEYKTMQWHVALSSQLIKLLILQLDKDSNSFITSHLQDYLSKNILWIEEITRHHHEKHDGKWYPNNIPWSKIPFLSKILTLADVFDAMMSKRPYKKWLSIDDIVQEFGKMSWVLFDPELVPLFVDMIREPWVQELYNGKEYSPLDYIKEQLDLIFSLVKAETNRRARTIMKKLWFHKVWWIFWNFKNKIKN